MLEPSDGVTCVEVDVIDDNIHENVQYFDIIFEFLISHSKLKFGSVGRAKVAIQDNDGN